MSANSQTLKVKKAYFLDAGYTVKGGKTYITLVVKGKKTVRLYIQHDPYFLVDAAESDIPNLLALTGIRKDGSISKPKRAEMIEKKVGLKKKSLIKLYCEQPSDVPIIKSKIGFTCFEYNIPFARRFVFDMQLTPLHVIHYEREGREIKKILSVTTGDPTLSLMSFDIETYNPTGIPNEEKDPAVMISYVGENSKGVITYKPCSKDFVQVVKTEKEMLEALTTAIKKENPDLLLGYNSSNFDLPYLKMRAQKTNANFNMGRFGKSIKFVNKGNIKGMRLDGRIHVDLFPIVKFFSFIGLIKAQSMSLDSVSEDVLKRKKVKMKKDEIWKIWDSNDIDLLCEYSLIDSDLTLELGKRFVPIQAELSSVAKMPLYETTLSTSGQLVENLLMYNASDWNQLIPSKPGGDTISERLEAPIQGAFVKLPEPGIYENMAVLDFRGLYPSIIISYNIDPGTLLSDPADASTESEYFKSPTDAKFSKKEKGLVPHVLDYLVEMRGKIKDELKTVDKSTDLYTRLSARSHALKILANSFYGYLGYARSRWYSRPCAESVTAWGRMHIAETIARAEASGFQVLYADTDSVFLIYKNKDDVIKFMNDVNDHLPDKMELELEGFYPRGVFVSKKNSDDDGTGAKKKYALLGEDGRTKIRGFELVRRDWSAVAKETQLKVLEAILKEGSKEKAAKIIKDTINELRSGKVPLERLAISTQITKDLAGYDIISPETTAAKKLAATGTVVTKGTIISYVIGKSGKTISDKAVPLEMAKDYDVDYYLDNQLMPAVMKIMKELGYDEYSLKVGGKQQSLDSFF
ncbi:hypothetical protein HY990_03410 [Candidatus Micrarchaeota archaeon]|nr:hypothetical protein [Candidatus Micrarchaeota archaeon]